MDRQKFIDKVAIVTGGSSGIGRAVVEEFCNEGASVTFTGISEIGITTEKELTEVGCNVQFVRGDMSEESFCHKVTDETIE